MVGCGALEAMLDPVELLEGVGVDSLDAVTLNAVSVFVLLLNATSVDEELLQLFSETQ